VETLPRDDIEKKPTFPTFEVDLSGDIMMKTLEHFAFTRKWHTKEQFLRDPAVAEWENPTPGTRINVRLLRYTRAGLLSRRRNKLKHQYEYRLSPKGEDRYIYMLKDRGLLDPANAKSALEKETMLTRLAAVKLFRNLRKADLESELRQLS
jgi:hypothetical protein